VRTAVRGEVLGSRSIPGALFSTRGGFATDNGCAVGCCAVAKSLNTTNEAAINKQARSHPWPSIDDSYVERRNEVITLLLATGTRVRSGRLRDHRIIPSLLTTLLSLQIRN